MDKKHLYLVAGVIWGIPGAIISIKGINAYRIQPSENLWWLLLITTGVLSGFFLMFRRIVNIYCDRISSLADKSMIWQTFPTRGWLLILFMMGLGITLKYIPGIPSAFTASFYSGLGPMLVISAIRFISHMRIPTYGPFMQINSGK